MRILITAILVAIWWSCTQSPAASGGGLQFDINQLKGRWESNNGKNNEVELWLSDSAGALRGSHFVLLGNDTIYIDYQQIHFHDSVCYYCVRSTIPSDSEKVEFPVKSSTATRIEFENLDYHFPQRIVYQLKEGNRMHCYIEGYENGLFRKVEFEYVKKD